MRIKKIEYENFRNFKDHGEIKCSTDGKVTIIYGKNGDGKTTLHQLFQWVFYGQVNFNKTTTERLYNLKYESECSYGEIFEVYGCVEFIHAGIDYSLKRTCSYKKGLNDSEKIAEDLILLYMDPDYNWKKIDNPKEIIEKLLPSGLSEYFFFDGESMIADLRVKGKESAGKLRKALYSMFDLDILESAINHIGRTDLKTTVLGKLYLSKGATTNNNEISVVKANIENFQAQLADNKEKLKDTNIKIEKYKNIILKISEQIGEHKSKKDYEEHRKFLQNQRDTFLKTVDYAQSQFGDAVTEIFPQLLISKAIKNAKKKVHLKIEENKLPEGISPQLINYLLKESTNVCVCGNHLGEKERKYIQSYLNLLPPKSYTNSYQDFTKTASKWGKGYDKEEIEKHIFNVLSNNKGASECDIKIKELDEEQKKSPNIENLIIDRQNAEEEISKLKETTPNLEFGIKKLELYIKKQMEKFDDLTEENKENKKIMLKINIMKEVASYFKEKLEKESKEYSNFLEENIQNLIDNMLTSKRHVKVSSEFSVRITDSFNDESKSEGQFAVVSFAYIGGILKMLRSKKHLADKEYPLVLDGPFSKLDPEQRQNVINVIPKFAPQVILFSKDDLHDVFDPNNIGYVWTIKSNEEKNIAHVEEGYLWK